MAKLRYKNCNKGCNCGETCISKKRTCYKRPTNCSKKDLPPFTQGPESANSADSCGDNGKTVTFTLKLTNVSKCVVNENKTRATQIIKLSVDSMKYNYLRFKLRFHGEEVVSLDVKQMQPTILAKVLHDSIGSNKFSDSIFEGDDVYVILQKFARLETRDEAKKYLFQLIFGKPMNDIGKMFEGDQHKWVDWINNYKSKEEPLNPHKEDRHTNLAWLLQYSEVQVMTGIWERLKGRDIPFLTIHDELLCKKEDAETVKSIMTEELAKHFKKFHVNIKS